MPVLDALLNDQIDPIDSLGDLASRTHMALLCDGPALASADGALDLLLLNKAGHELHSLNSVTFALALVACLEVVLGLGPRPSAVRTDDLLRVVDFDLFPIKDVFEPDVHSQINRRPLLWPSLSEEVAKRTPASLLPFVL